MACIGAAHHLVNSHSSSEQSRLWSSSSSSLLHHHLVPHASCSSSRQQQQHSRLLPALCSSALDGCICSGSPGHHQHHHHQQPLTCSSSNNNNNNIGGSISSHHAQQQQHWGGGNNNATTAAAAAGAGGNWALAACSAPAAAEVGFSPSLGWNAGFFSTYRLGEVVGHGSFGTVHRAVHRQTGTSYAVKVLQKSSSKRGMQLDAIQREVSTLQQAQGSKYAAKLEGLFEDEDHAYIVQEECRGGTLREHLANKGRCSEQEAACVMQGVLDLLAECHKRSICYADLKPANIMFSGNSTQDPHQVRVIDFGCSHMAKGCALSKTCGSPLYMAPEVLMQRYGVGVDVWSAGVLLYQMLTGRLPFWPKKSLEEVAKLPAYEILAATRTYEVQFPHSMWADISPAARDLVERMLDRNPATRITAAQALQHPWISAALGALLPASSDGAAAAARANNVVGFRTSSSSNNSSSSQPHSSPTRPIVVPLSPGKGSGAAAAAAAAGGPLSPQRPSPLRARLSAELPASMLVADMHRAHPVPSMVAAAE